MKKFNLKNVGNNYYDANILDIWYQDNKIVAYVEGTNIYKTEMIINNDEIENYYCSCPSSDGGMSFCKHLSGIANYLKENAILQLESEPKSEEKIDLSLKLDEIINKFRSAIYNLVDSYYGRINCYNSSKYCEIITKYTKYIDALLDKKRFDEAFSLIIQFLSIATSVTVDGEDDYYEAMAEIMYYIDELIVKYNYKDNIINYINENYKETEVSTIGIKLIYALINNIEGVDDAKKIVNIINEIPKDDYDKYDLIEEMINITYDYIGLNEALMLANKHKSIYGVNRKIIEYLEELNDEEKLIEEIKRQIKEYNNRNLYEKLLNIYLKDNIEEAQNLLVVMISEFHRIEYYKKLKSITNKAKMNEYKDVIINGLNKSRYRNTFVLEIYEEDNMIDKLFEQIKKYNDLELLSSYKEKIDKEYHTELIDYYIKLIISKAKNCYGRNEYYQLCVYIKDLYTLNCSSDLIIKMLKDMYPFYKTKKAFKEEIASVLKRDDKNIFETMV